MRRILLCSITLVGLMAVPSAARPDTPIPAADFSYQTSTASTLFLSHAGGLNAAWDPNTAEFTFDGSFAYNDNDAGAQDRSFFDLFHEPTLRDWSAVTGFKFDLTVETTNASVATSISPTQITMFSPNEALNATPALDPNSPQDFGNQGVSIIGNQHAYRPGNRFYARLDNGSDGVDIFNDDDKIWEVHLLDVTRSHVGLSALPGPKPGGNYSVTTYTFEFNFDNVTDPKTLDPNSFKWVNFDGSINTDVSLIARRYHDPNTYALTDPNGYGKTVLRNKVESLRISGFFRTPKWIGSDEKITVTLENMTLTGGAPAACPTRQVATTGDDTSNDCSDPNDPCLTIQHAVDEACSGDTINVAAGTYDEQVVIDKSVTVLGAGIGSTIVEPSSVSANTTHLVSAAPIAAIVLVDDTTGVTIQDLTVDGASAAFGSCSPGYMGIYYRNASGTVDTTSIENVFHPTAVGCQQVVGILVQSGGSGTSDVTITGSSVSNYGKNGITCNEIGTTCSITFNTVTGRGPVPFGDAAQNAIQMGSGAVGSIEDNAASDNIYIPQTWCSTGILVFSTDGIEVKRNVLTDNFCDLLVLTNSSTIESNEISAALEFPFSILGNSNTVTGNIVNGSPFEGMYIDGTGNVLTCNRVTSNGTGIFYDTVSTIGTPNVTNMNSIFGNATGVDASAVSTGDPIIDATDNWWGCVGGPGSGGCDTAVGHVDVSSPASAPPACVSCNSNADCDDTLACNGVETCNTSTSMCLPGTPVDCSAECLTGACLEPTGTCELSPELAPCDTGEDTCSELDECDGSGNCENTGGGGDTDEDGTCQDDDNCPDDPNPSQADLDNDGEGDICDENDAAGLSIKQVKVKKSRAPDRDSWFAVGELDATTSAALLADAAADGATVTVSKQGGGGSLVTINSFTFTGDECTDKRGSLRCKDDDTKSRLKLQKRGAVEFFRIKMKLKRQDLTLPDLADTPLVITIQTTGFVDRQDEIDSCTAKPRKVDCREAP